MVEKHTAFTAKLENDISALETAVAALPDSGSDDVRAAIRADLIRARSELTLIHRMKSEIARMKRGSIALVGQITTISKLRIHDPKSGKDVLGGIRLSDESLNAIDNALRFLYLPQNQ